MNTKFIKRLTTSTLLILLSSFAFGQNYEFIVIGAKGSNFIDGKALKIGARLNLGQKVELKDGSYVGLAHKTYKTLELEKAGTYTVADLVKQLNSDSIGVFERYARFVADELTSPDERLNRYNQRIKSGAVSRGSDDKIKFMLPSGTSYVIPDGKITVKWYFDGDEVPTNIVYTVNVKEVTINEEKILFATETKDTLIKLNLSDPVYKEARNLKLEVKTTYKGEDLVSSYGLRKLRGSKLRQFEEEVKSFSNTTSALSKIILARFFEEKKLFANAINLYEEALAATNIDQYWMLYNEFLNGNMLTRESRKKDSPNE